MPALSPPPLYSVALTDLLLVLDGRDCALRAPVHRRVRRRLQQRRVVVRHRVLGRENLRDVLLISEIGPRTNAESLGVKSLRGLRVVRRNVHLVCVEGLDCGVWRTEWRV